MANKKKLIMAALAGLAVGASAHAQPGKAKPDGAEVKCYGINGCASHAGCGVKKDDIAAVRQLLGDSEFETRFGKTTSHSCGSHASCGAAQHILNWTKVSQGECQKAGGIVIEEQDGKKTAKTL